MLTDWMEYFFKEYMEYKDGNIIITMTPQEADLVCDAIEQETDNDYMQGYDDGKFTEGMGHVIIDVLLDYFRAAKSAEVREVFYSLISDLSWAFERNGDNSRRTPEDLFEKNLAKRFREIEEESKE